MTTLETGDALAAAVQKTPHRVTLDSLRAKIVAEEFFHPTFAPHLTVAVLQTENGFTLVGKSAPADPANFDAEAGKTFARDDAIRQLWALEGYLLREKMFMAEPVTGPLHERFMVEWLGRPGNLIAEVPKPVFDAMVEEIPASKRLIDRLMAKRGIESIVACGRTVVPRVDLAAKTIVFSEPCDVVDARASSANTTMLSRAALAVVSEAVQAYLDRADDRGPDPDLNPVDVIEAASRHVMAQRGIAFPAGLRGVCSQVLQHYLQREVR